MKITKEIHKTEVIDQLPCIKCGYDGELKYYRDEDFCTCKLSCPKCKYSASGSPAWRETFAYCVETYWNPANDRDTHLKRCQEALNDLPNQEKKLKKLLKVLKGGLFYKDV